MFASDFELNYSTASYLYDSCIILSLNVTSPLLKKTSIADLSTRILMSVTSLRLVTGSAVLVK